MPRTHQSRFTVKRVALCVSLTCACLFAFLNYFAATSAATAGLLPPQVAKTHATSGVESRPVTQAADSETTARVRAAYGELPLQFEANRGQTDPSVKFLARGSGYNLFLTSNEAVLTLSNPGQGKGRGAARERAVLRMKLSNSNPSPTVEGEQPLAGKSYYFSGAGSTKSPLSAETYERIKYSGVYDGVDAFYYSNQGQLEYDFVVHPHADPAQIVVAFDGAQHVAVDEQGEMVVRTAPGEVRHHKPTIYQEVGGVRREVTGRYVSRGAHEVGFEVGAYDPSLPLVIDPVLVYSTYIGGGSSDDTANGVAVDSAGNAYITGQTISTDFPTTPGAFQPTFGGFNYDAYVLKLNPAGNAVVYSTYLGGGNSDQGYDIAVDAAGNAYVTGRTISTDFPVTAGSLQPAFGGGSFPGGLGGDAFVAKLNPTGSALVYSTYLGGASTEYGYGIALDAQRNA